MSNDGYGRKNLGWMGGMVGRKWISGRESYLAAEMGTKTEHGRNVQKGDWKA